MAQQALKIFHYLEDLDCFIVHEEYKHIADYLGLTEWHPVVWLGRLFLLDNDYGEHWFDNWDLREQKRPEAEQRGIADEELMIIDPGRFKNEVDGPCHTPEFRQKFWTDVLRSLELSYDLLFEEARLRNESAKAYDPGSYLEDLEERITKIKKV